MTMNTTQETQTQAAVPATKRKIYCFNNGGSPGWYHAIAIAEDGHVLAGHVCSHPSFIPHDLGIASTWKHEKYNAHYGEGNWELELVAYEDLDNHPGLKAAFAKNDALQAAEASKPEAVA